MTIKTYDDTTHVAVPREPDFDMNEAGFAAVDWEDIRSVPQLVSAYKAMIAAAPEHETVQQTRALDQYNKFMEGEEETDPVERLRFFLSCALKGQDWIDVEQFIDALKSETVQQEPVAWKDTLHTAHEDGNEEHEPQLLGYEGWESLPDGTDLYPYPPDQSAKIADLSAGNMALSEENHDLRITVAELEAKVAELEFISDQRAMQIEDQQATIAKQAECEASLKEQIKVAREALERCDRVLDECKDYPITHDEVIEALMKLGEQ